MKKSTKGYSYSKMFIDDILKKSSGYNKLFGMLKMKQKKQRSFDLSKMILAACIDEKRYPR